MCCFALVFFFKQKTAYEMRISDWSSDVCSSDLAEGVLGRLEAAELGDVGAGGEGLVARPAQHQRPGIALAGGTLADLRQTLVHAEGEQIGRASCRERVCQYV